MMGPKDIDIKDIDIIYYEYMNYNWFNFILQYIMEYLIEVKKAYKDTIINKYNNYKGIQTEDDLLIVLRSTQLSKETRREIIELWREDPIHKLEEKYGKEMLKRVFKKKMDEICENELDNILSRFSNEEKKKILEEMKS
jgi:hypothetical protein